MSAHILSRRATPEKVGTAALYTVGVGWDLLRIFLTLPLLSRCCDVADTPKAVFSSVSEQRQRHSTRHTTLPALLLIPSLLSPLFAQSVGWIDEPDTDASAMSLSNPPPPSKRRCYVGHDQSYRRDNLYVTSPVQHGVITDWDAIESLLSFTLRSHLSLEPQQHPILWCEPTGGSREQRERMLQLLMDKAGVPALFFCKTAVLSAFAAGRSTALICESGAGVTTVAPVHEGYVLNKGVRRTKVAGNTLDAIAQQMVFPQSSSSASSSSSSSSPFDRQPVPLYAIQRSYTPTGEVSSHRTVIPPLTTPSYHSYMQGELIRDVKETVCRLSETPFDANGAKYPTVQYELPDGRLLEVGNERFLVAEHMFQPQLGAANAPHVEEFDASFTFSGLQHMLRSAVDSVDLDLHKELYSSLVLSGGTSLLAGFPNRVSRELAVDLPAAHKVKVVTGSSTTDRKYASWIGGSILASLGTFHQMWVSKAEYEEHGTRIIHTKCP